MPTKQPYIDPNDVTIDPSDVTVDDVLVSSDPMGQTLRQDYPWVHHYLRPTLEGGGLTVGGLIGGPAGAGLGYSIGRQGANLVEEALGQRVPEAFAERMTGALQDSLVGKYLDKFGNTIGGMLGGTVQKLLSPGLGKANTPGAQYRAALGEKYGVPLTPADITGSKGQALLESGLEKTLTGGDVVQDFRNRQLGKWNAIREDFVPRDISKQDAGDAIKRGLRDKSSGAYATAQGKYAKVGEIIPKDEPFSVSNVNQLAHDLLNEEYMLKPSFQEGKEVMGQLEELATMEGTTWPAAQKLRTRLMDLERKLDPMASQYGYKGAGQGSVGPFKRLRAALDEDMRLAAEQASPDAQAAYRDAADYYRDTIKGVYGGKTAKTIMGKDPEFITSWATSMGEGKTAPITRIRTLKQALSPEDFALIQEQFTANNLFGTNAKDQVPVNQLKSVMSKYGDDFLSELYSPDQLARLNEVANLGSSLMTAEKIAGNPSGTAQASGMISTIGNIIRHPVTGTLSAMAPKPLAESYLSGSFRNYILRGDPIPFTQTLGGVAGQATKMGGVGAIDVATDAPVGKTKDGKPVYKTSDGRYWTN